MERKLRQLFALFRDLCLRTLSKFGRKLSGAHLNVCGVVCACAYITGPCSDLVIAQSVALCWWRAMDRTNVAAFRFNLLAAQ